MYIKKVSGYILARPSPHIPQLKGLLDIYIPKTIRSSMWKYWRAIIDLKLGAGCRSRHGKIYSTDEIVYDMPPLHDNCRCAILPLEAIISGGATKDGMNGADYWLSHYGGLPDYYISDREIRALGWKNGKPPAKYAPGKMYTRGVYNNDDDRLPSVPGRISYEADINYYSGRRNGHRILFSNDGLLFVTYDHYLTFCEIIIGG